MIDIVPIAEPELITFNASIGRRIAIRYRPSRDKQPTIVFLPGYASDMEGAKAVAIDRFCAGRGLGCLRLDYSGTGRSPGDFADGTLTRWIEEVEVAIDAAAPTGGIILAGSSMGGWIALHVALRRRDQVAGVLGIAAAPDFTEWGFSAEDEEIMLRDGLLERANPYGPEKSVTHLGFWRSGEMLKLLGRPIDLAIPVRLVHGADDEVVPVAIALRLLERLGSSDVQLRLIKGAGHRLSEAHEIDAILAELDSLVEIVNRKKS